MMKRQSGFTLVEILITMAVFVFAIAAASRIFTGLLTQFKQQSKIAETNIEGIVGLDMLRKDIAQAGLGLPWNVDENSVADANGDGNLWDEVGALGYTEATDPAYNDAPNNPPSAFKSGNGAFADGSDRLVIKSASAAVVAAAGKNTRLSSALPPNHVRRWNLYTEDLDNPDRVIVLSPGSTNTNSRSLVVTGGSYHTRFDTVSAYSPVDDMDVRLVYGISGANAANSLRAPFNRTDYYLSAANMPTRCATGTSVLVKATLNHDTTPGLGDFSGEMPVLDCVADMQVIYGVDTDAVLDNAVNCYVNNLADVLAPNDAENVRNRVKEVRVYILSHEGQIERDFTFNPPIAPSSVRVGEASANLPGGSCTGAAAMGRDYDLSGITDWQNYRWKVYAISVETDNLR